MQFQLDQAIPVLERTPATLRALLADLDDPWTRSRYGGDTFSPFDVVGHLIHGEKTDWIVRARHILLHGDAIAFEPFDRYAMRETSRGRSMNDLLDEFANLRAANLESLRSLQLSQADLDRTGMHPTLGRVTMRQLLATWVAHDLNHLHQIAKCMAIQFRGECGPWAAFMGVFGAG
jgi:hypothetical protein